MGLCGLDTVNVKYITVYPHGLRPPLSGRTFPSLSLDGNQFDRIVFASTIARYAFNTHWLTFAFQCTISVPAQLLVTVRMLQVLVILQRAGPP